TKPNGSSDGRRPPGPIEEFCHAVGMVVSGLRCIRVAGRTIGSFCLLTRRRFQWGTEGGVVHEERCCRGAEHHGAHPWMGWKAIPPERRETHSAGRARSRR